MNYKAFFQSLKPEPELQSWLEALLLEIEIQANRAHGDLSKWQQLVDDLPNIFPSSIDLNAAAVTVGNRDDVNQEMRVELEQRLKQLHPWRKGPFELFGLPIDTEWHSDWKWDRLKNHIQPLQGRTVLDVGCGNGYHCWRMAGAGAELVVGIDPTMVFVMQYQALQHFINSSNVIVLPVGIDAVQKHPLFDTVFSMGVLYHRRSPIDHLLDLGSLLKPNGELVLETLIIESGASEVLFPSDRYAQMRNVWFIPSCDLLRHWLARCGYENISLVDISHTTTAEQRSTDWMTFQSLQDYLLPDDPSRTIEGYPAPVRAIFTATKK